MRLSAFVLFVVLLALIAVLATHCEIERVRCGYRMGRLIVERDSLRSKIIAREAEISELKSPARLEILNVKLGLNLRPIPSGLVPTGLKGAGKFKNGSDLNIRHGVRVN